MRFRIFESSSAGNCSLLETEDASVLIDAGLGLRKTAAHLAAAGKSFESLDAIFITHDHKDHCKCLEYVSQFRNLKIFASKAAAEAIKYSVKNTKELNWKTFFADDVFEFQGIRISPFPVMHDCAETVGYAFRADGKTLVYATDLGKVTHLVRENAKRANVLVLESNYCPALLEKAERPYEVKRRIKGPNGHLSNENAIELLNDLDCGVVEKIFLAHVSKESNSLPHIGDLLRAGVSADLLPKIEIICPFMGKSAVYEG